jgi:hypothetical protein
MPKTGETVRKKFLRENPKFLKHESLVYLIVDKEIVTLGILVREEDLLIKQPPILCLRILGADIERALHHIKGAKNVKLVQLSTIVFSYAPILK